MKPVKKITATVDRELTTIATADAMKDACKDFTARFTPGDLLRAYNEATNKYISGHIITCTAELYPESIIDSTPHANVEMLVYCWTEFHIVKFFCNAESLTVDCHPVLIDQSDEVFKSAPKA